VAAMSLRDEQGVSLPELLMGITISLVILAATLAAFNTFYGNARDQDERFDTAETARNALDNEARQLRNLAKRLNNTAVIDTVAAYDLIFQTSDPSRTWVRYCLDTATPPASAERGRLWMAEQSLAGDAAAPVSATMRGGCPGAGWTRVAVVADHVTNRLGGQDRPLFAYTCTDRTSACTSSGATYDQILGIAAQTIVDTQPGAGAIELKVASAVHLRNQNQAPNAQFVTTATGGRTVLLNASGSSDYEGRIFSMYWFKGTMPTSIACDQPTVTIGDAGQRILWGGTLIGDGVTLSHAFPAGDGNAGTAKNIGLVACDPGDRYGTAGIAPGPAIAVTIPSGA